MSKRHLRYQTEGLSIELEIQVSDKNQILKTINLGNPVLLNASLSGVGIMVNDDIPIEQIRFITLNWQARKWVIKGKPIIHQRGDLKTFGMCLEFDRKNTYFDWANFVKDLAQLGIPAQ